MTVTTQDIGGRHSSETGANDDDVVVFGDFILSLEQHELVPRCISKSCLGLKTLDEYLEKVMESVTIK